MSFPAHEPPLMACPHPMDKKAFITGGTGFVGSHLVESLAAHGYSEVRCLVRTRLKWLEDTDIIPIHGTLGNRSLIEDAVRDVDYVYHLGGVTRAKTYADLHAGNVRATVQLLDAILAVNPGIAGVLVTSSLAAVGAAPGGRATETTPLQPISRYGRSKATMEAALKPYRSHLPITVVRPPVVYGPRERDVFTFFKAVQQGICLVPRGDPGLTLVHVADLARGMVEATESDATTGETYFIGNDEDISWDKLKRATMHALGTRALTVSMPRSLVLPLATVVEGVSALFGQYPPFNMEKGRELLRAAKICSSDKAARDFGYQPQVSLQEGLRCTIEWYRQQGWLRPER